ncbi:MAG: hypothetical protein KDM91_05985 [Verrucomicrobiae bacterium]|nr:hypothetical protein [Candidatus Omnitrophota bacterium]MCB1234602.1 hypothetical protein [Verrucomicrobiae bacterium]MCP5540386.1 hypothetical protein [Akkermansiaceae bacterium]
MISTRILQVDTWPLTIFGTAAIKELDAELREKSGVIESLQKENSELKRRLERLEKLVLGNR